jgi:CHAT domain-containing protein
LLAIGACQQEKKPVSVEEAKKVTASFEGTGLLAPPRTIADITAILDQQKPDPAERARAIARAEAPAPSDLDDNQLVDFYRNRSGANLAIGRFKQALEDAEEANRLRRGTGTKFAYALNAVAQAEQALGHGGRARKIRETIVERANAPPARIAALFGLVQAAVGAGDLAAAERYMAQSDQDLAEQVARTGKPSRQAIHTFNTLLAQQSNARTHAALAFGAGRYGEAESWTKKGIAYIDQAIEMYPEASALAAEHPEIIAQPEPISFLYADRLEQQNTLANSLIWQGRLLEAEAAAREALLYALKQFGRSSPRTAGAAATLGRVLYEENRLADGEKLYRAALDINLAAGAPSRVIYFSLADIVASRGRYQDSYELYQKAVAASGGEERVGGKWHSIARINVYRLTGHLTEAVEIGRAALAATAKAQGEDAYQTAEVRGTLAYALTASGAKEEALREYERAAARLLQPGGGDQDQSDRITRRQWRAQAILAGYIYLLADIRGTPLARQLKFDPVEEAFRLADATRGGTVDRAFAAEAARTNLRDPDLADMARREQDAQQQIAARRALLTNALSVPTEEQDAAAIATLRGDIDRLQAARTVLLEQIAKRSPQYAQFLDPHPTSVVEARAALHAGEALVATYATGDRVLVWAVAKEKPLAFAVAAIKPAEVAQDVRALRHALDPNAASLNDVPPFDVGIANRLYAALLEPVAAGWKGASDLVTVPHGALAQIPLGLLVTAPTPMPVDRPGEALFSGYRTVPFLVRAAAVTQLPSVASLVTLRALPAGAAIRAPFAGFGDPWFTTEQAAQAAQPANLETDAALVATRGLHLRAVPATQTLGDADLSALPRLPDTAEEVRQVAIILKADVRKDVFLGAAANEMQVRSMRLDDRRVVMFATHGLVPGDLDGLAEPALALSAPAVAGGGDGLLTMEKILGLKLDADWVVLSACNTAAGDGAGAEAVSGLGRAFFYAGARAVLVTNWPVETRSARLLTTDTFRRQGEDPRLSRAAALHQAELALIDGPGAVDGSGRTVYSYAHPIFWAPFSLVGDGG